MIIKIFQEKPLSLGLYSELPKDLKNVDGLVYEPTQEEIDLINSCEPIKFEGGKVVLDIQKKNSLDLIRDEQIKKEKINDELIILENWFTWYDTQTIQYERDMRKHKSSNIDINKLDDEAYLKAERIKELRKLLK